MNPAEWKAWLAARKAEDWELIESEWHQETFAFREGSDSEADLAFPIYDPRAQNKTRRVILRGELKVANGSRPQSTQESLQCGRAHH